MSEIDSLITATTASAKSSVAQSVKYVPNMAALHEDTTVMVYREYKPRTDSVEITIFYQEPGEDKMRIDLELIADMLTLEEEDLGPQHFKVIKWAKAEGFIT